MDPRTCCLRWHIWGSCTNLTTRVSSIWDDRHWQCWVPNMPAEISANLLYGVILREDRWAPKWEADYIMRFLCWRNTDLSLLELTQTPDTSFPFLTTVLPAAPFPGFTKCPTHVIPHNIASDHGSHLIYRSNNGPTATSVPGLTVCPITQKSIV